MHCPESRDLLSGFPMTSRYLLLVSSVFGGYRLSRSIQKDLEDVAILRSIPDFFGFSCFQAEFSYPRPPKLSWVLPIPKLSQIVTDLNHWVGTLASDQLPREASAGCSVYFAKGKKYRVAMTATSPVRLVEMCWNVADLGCWEVQFQCQAIWSQAMNPQLGQKVVPFSEQKIRTKISCDYLMMILICVMISDERLSSWMRHAFEWEVKGVTTSQKLFWFQS